MLRDPSLMQIQYYLYEAISQRWTSICDLSLRYSVSFPSVHWSIPHKSPPFLSKLRTSFLFPRVHQRHYYMFTSYSCSQFWSYFWILTLPHFPYIICYYILHCTKFSLLSHSPYTQWHHCIQDLCYFMLQWTGIL